MGRVTAFVYGVVSYVIFFGTFLYAIGFLGNFYVPKSIDSGPQGPITQAILINIALLGIFAIPHSVMARPGFKKWWTKFVPQPIERSTYVLYSSLALILMFAMWQPIGGTVWDVQDPTGRTILYTVYGMGWLMVLISTFMINHFDLFGLRQVYLHLRGKEYTHLKFGTPGFYKYMRHPLYVGWFTVFWATPTMTIAHLLFAVATTTYILIAILFEERDLVSHHGEAYINYRERTRMFLPFRKGKTTQVTGTKLTEIPTS